MRLKSEVHESGCQHPPNAQIISVKYSTSIYFNFLLKFNSICIEIIFLIICVAYVIYLLFYMIGKYLKIKIYMYSRIIKIHLYDIKENIIEIKAKLLYDL